MGSMMKEQDTLAMAMGYIILEGLIFISSHIFCTRGHTNANSATMLGMNWPRMQVTTT